MERYFVLPKNVRKAFYAKTNQMKTKICEMELCLAASLSGRSPPPPMPVLRALLLSVEEKTVYSV